MARIKVDWKDSPTYARIVAFVSLGYNSTSKIKNLNKELKLILDDPEKGGLDKDLLPINCFNQLKGKMIYEVNGKDTPFLISTRTKKSPWVYIYKIDWKVFLWIVQDIIVSDFDDYIKHKEKMISELEKNKNIYNSTFKNFKYDYNELIEMHKRSNKFVAETKINTEKFFNLRFVNYSKLLALVFKRGMNYVFLDFLYLKKKSSLKQLIRQMLHMLADKFERENFIEAVIHSANTAALNKNVDPDVQIDKSDIPLIKTLINEFCDIIEDWARGRYEIAL